MFLKEDNTYNELREKSIMQWIDLISEHKNFEIKGGAIAAKEYIDDLKKQIKVLEEKNNLKDKYLKKFKVEKSKTT